MYTTVIERADKTMARNERLRTQAAHLVGDARALMVKYRGHRFPRFSGASDLTQHDHVRVLLRAFVSRIGQPRSFVGYSRGSTCQTCGNTIKAGDVEYDVVVGATELRLDEICYRVFLEESRVGNGGGTRTP